MAGAESREETSLLSLQGLGEIPSALLLRANEITHLVLSNNPGLQLSATIAKFINLKVLNLCGTCLSSIPVELEQLTQLTTLHVFDNKLTVLPDCLGNLSSLTTLHVGRNQLSALPDCLGNLSSLTTLHVFDNKLTVLPDCLGNLSSLAKLVASNNCFESYPMVTMKLQLNDLDLSNEIYYPNRNAIRHMPLELASNTSLRTLKMSGNPMVRPPLAICDQGIGVVLKYLKELSLGASTVCPQTVSMLGETEAGKTSIVMSLYDGKPLRASPDERTRVMSRTQIYHRDNRVLVINDFGGHPIYQTVLAVFLPPSGIGIIVYDMSKDLETQTEAVGRWMTTIFAKSPALKLIIVGSHLDCPQGNAKDDKSSMQKFVRNKVESTLKELNKHISAVEIQMRRSAGKMPAAALKSKWEALKESLSLIQSNTCPVCFVSCVSGVGIEGLRSLVFDMVGPSSEFPTHWVKVVQKIVHPDNEKHCRASYLKMDEAITIYQEIVSSAQMSQNELKDDGLNIILEFLTRTCHVLWHTNHETLGGCIFHRVSHILDICKAVLHHDVLLDESARGTARQDLDLYKRGHLTERFLHQLLQPLLSPSCSIHIIVYLLTQFNLISLVKDSGLRHMYIVPSLLPAEPGNLEFSPSEPNIRAQIDFSGETIPLSFFETYTAAVLQPVNEQVILNGNCWKDGVGFKSCGVKLACRRLKDKDGKHLSELVLDSSTPASNVHDLLKVTRRVFCALQKHIVHTWKGAYCHGYFPCPGCRLLGNDNFNSFPFDVELIGMDNAREDFSFECHVCGLDIPRALVTVCSPETITDRDCTDVMHFFATHGGSTGSAGRILEVEPQELRKNTPKLVDEMSDVGIEPQELRKNTPKLVDEMSDVGIIIGRLYSKNVLNLYQKEELEACQVRHRQVGLLLSMLERKSSVCIGAFVQALRDTNQHNLAVLFDVSSMFETQTAESAAKPSYLEQKLKEFNSLKEEPVDVVIDKLIKRDVLTTSEMLQAAAADKYRRVMDLTSNLTKDVVDDVLTEVKELSIVPMEQDTGLSKASGSTSAEEGNISERVTSEEDSYVVGCSDKEIGKLVHKFTELRDSGQVSVGSTYGTDFFVIGDFDERGGFLILRKMSAYLEIPRGALKHKKTVYFSVLADSNRAGAFACFSLCYECGPDGMTFDLPVILQVPHSLRDTETNLVTAFTRKNESPEWIISTDAKVIFQDGRATIGIQHFCSFLLGIRLFFGLPMSKELCISYIVKHKHVTFYIMEPSAFTTFKNRSNGHCGEKRLYTFVSTKGRLIIAESNENGAKFSEFNPRCVMTSPRHQTDLQLADGITEFMFYIRQDSKDASRIGIAVSRDITLVAQTPTEQRADPCSFRHIDQHADTQADADESTLLRWEFKTSFELPLARALIEAAKSVCFIRSRNRHTTGTGFRIGPQHVLTAWHVVEKIKALADEIEVIFDYNTDQQTTFGMKFNLTQTYKQVGNLDAVILELKSTSVDGNILPPRLQTANVSQNVCEVHVIGHHEGKHKQLDKPCKVHYLNHHEKALLQNNASYLGMLVPPVHLLYTCGLGKGASGGPVLSFENGTLMVIAMHVRRFPKKRHALPFTPLFPWYEAGLKMSAIHDELQNSQEYMNILGL